MSTLARLRRAKDQAPRPEAAEKRADSAEKSTSVKTGHSGFTETGNSSQVGTLTPYAAVLAADAAGKLPAAAPCQSCGCPLFWLDPYGRVRCAECSPPPNVNVQRGDLHVLAIGDAFEWSHRLPDLTPRLEPDDTPRQRTASQIVASTLDSLRPTTEQVDAGECCDESPACEVCKKKFLQQNIFGENFCDGCKPPRRRRDGGSTASRAIVDSIVLRTLVEQSPEAAAFRERAIRKRKSLESVE